ncbi:dynein regulatory complex protein 9-like [Pararge aegeria]|uniref:dynein regulatory complex protein 9-like n=1 Tax=Pararge aegeria TaxID=116150 RepID=UPI0019D14AA1|nr:dynein regulatory complex protein 9-like [Pararge aegeria]
MCITITKRLLILSHAFAPTYVKLPTVQVNRKIRYLRPAGTGSYTGGCIGALDALLLAINLEVMLLQMKIIERSAERRLPESGQENKREKQVREKLSKDRHILKEVIIRTLAELAEGGEWYTLKKAVNMFEKNAGSLITLRTQNQKLKMSLDSMNRELQENRQKRVLEIRSCDFKVASLRDSIKDTLLNARIQFDYTERWLCARAESVDLQFQVAPAAPAPKPEHENCVHDELLRAYMLQIKEREDLLQYWKQRYAADTADIDVRLRDQYERLRVTAARREEMEKLYKLHEGEMRAWLTFKKERAARLAREARLRNAATRIQAWWRGVMVRRALGSFRYLRNLKKIGSKTKKK